MNIAWQDLLDSIATHVISFLVGVVAGGALAIYYGDYFTDRRRAREEQEKRLANFRETQEMLPEAIAEIRKMLEKKPLLREFEIDYHKIDLKLRVLESRGYVRIIHAIRDTGTWKIPDARCILIEDFVDLLTNKK